MSTNSGIDTDCMTLTRFLLAEQRRNSSATGDLTQLMNAIQTAVKAISSAANRTGIAERLGISGDRRMSSSREEVIKLDALANETFINMLRSSFTTCLLVSEENEQHIEIELHKQGNYIVCFDPLDGESNIDCLISIGSIFAVYKKTSDGPASVDDALQPGRNIVAAGYALYGSATMIVLSIGRGVNGFILDPSIGEFLLTDPDMRIKPRGKIYSINEGYDKYWYPPIRDYINGLKNPKKEDVQPYSGRYVGSMVSDVHRTLKYGGIFMYPATKDSPKGKLRLLYECIPMAFIIEQAGGLASNGSVPILDVVPLSIHQRSPVFLGSKEDVSDVLECLDRYTGVT